MTQLTATISAAVRGRSSRIVSRGTAALALALWVAACDGLSRPAPTTPSMPAAQTPTAPQPPAAPPRANLQAVGVPAYSCTTGYCTSLAHEVTNLGPGCATDVNLVFRAYGNNGAPGAPQLGLEIPMGLRGAALATYVWKPGETLLLVSLSGFSDVRSAGTVFRFTETHTDIFCQFAFDDRATQNGVAITRLERFVGAFSGSVTVGRVSFSFSATGTDGHAQNFQGYPPTGVDVTLVRTR
jgi:hypothetical protein